MLKIFNLMDVFFEDTYREVSVREYAKIKKMSPPTASKALRDLEKEGLLLSQERGIYLFFRANREHYLFRSFTRAYWQDKVHRALKEVQEEALNRKMVLFGSLVKAENTLASDADVFVDLPYRKLDTKKAEASLRRPIQLHFQDSLKNPSLKESIGKGVEI